MIEALQFIIGGALERVWALIKHDLPPLLAALIILSISYLLARLARWVIHRGFKGIEVDAWLRNSGVSSMLDQTGGLHASRAAGQIAYWVILLLGGITALNVFGSQITTRLADWVTLLLPRMVAAGAIVLGGFWLAQYLARSVLVWAVNEDLPSPRRLAAGVRVLIVLATVAVASQTVNFAGPVFLASFILILGGLMLAAGLAVGLGARDSVRRHLEPRQGPDAAGGSEGVTERSLWSHL